MVEAVVSGSLESVLALEELLRKGPRFGEVHEVREVKSTAIEVEQWLEFRILPDGEGP